jgi:hypothetical protein
MLHANIITIKFLSKAEVLYDGGGGCGVVRDQGSGRAAIRCVALLGYLMGDLTRVETPSIIEICGNEEFHLGRDPELW